MMESDEMVTLEEFIRQHNSNIVESNKVCREKYEQRISRALDEYVLEETVKKHMWKRAYKVVTNTLRVNKAFTESIEANNDKIAIDLLNGRATLEEPPEGSRELWQTVQNVIAEYQGLFEEAFLLINAPKGDSEKDARDIHLQDFYNVVVRGKEIDQFPSMPCIASKYEDIVIAVQCFLRCLAKNAKRATVVYNGHGKPTGHLALDGEERSPHNSTLLSDIYQLWHDNKSQAEKEGVSLYLPSDITVVFAQCYGFMHSQTPEQKQVIKVVSLATPREPITTYKYECGKFKNQTYIKKSVHVELSAYASKRSLESEDDDSSLGSSASLSSADIAMASLGITPRYSQDTSNAWTSETDININGPSTCNADTTGCPEEMFIPSLFVSSAMSMQDNKDIRSAAFRERQTSVQDIWRNSHRLSQNWKRKPQPRYSCSDALADVMKVGLLSMHNAMPHQIKTSNGYSDKNKSKGTSGLKKGTKSKLSAISAFAEKSLQLVGDMS